jgi:hypothetical protein
VVAPGTRAHRQVVRWRPRSYPVRPEAYRRRSPAGKMVWVADPGGEGREIAAERQVCPRCTSAPPTT